MLPSFRTQIALPSIGIPIIKSSQSWDHFLMIAWIPKLARHSWSHDDVIKWKHFPRYWPFVRGIHRSPVNSPHRGQWRGAWVLYLHLDRRLSKQSRRWWFETPSRPLWRPRSVRVMRISVDVSECFTIRLIYFAQLWHINAFCNMIIFSMYLLGHMWKDPHSLITQHLTC